MYNYKAISGSCTTGPAKKGKRKEYDGSEREERLRVGRGGSAPTTEIMPTPLLDSPERANKWVVLNYSKLV